MDGLQPTITRVRIRVVLAGVAVAVITHAAVQAQSPAPLTDLVPVLRSLLEQSKAPALAAAVVRDGKLVALGVCGVRAIDSNEPATPEDRFPIGSCSKPMARLALARLAERGAIDFDAPLTRLLEGTPMRDEYRDVTLADLLAHRAGIQPYTEIGPQITPILFESTGPPREQRAAFTAHVLGEAPAAPPRTRFLYSNAGFCVLATVAERAAGRDWETLVAEEVFGPLGLKSATAGGKGTAVRGHHRTPEGPRAVRPFPRLPAMVPAGGVSLSIADFAAFAAAQAELEAGRPVEGLTEKTLRRLPELRPADAPRSARGGQITFGGDGQFHAAFATWPQERAAIAVACNLGDSDDLCTQVIEAVRAAVAPGLAASAEAGGPPGASGPRYGYGLKIEGDRIEVADVTPGSIAEKAGLKAGDMIVSINGVAAGGIDEAERMKQLRSSPLTLVVDRAGRQVEIKLTK